MPFSTSNSSAGLTLRLFRREIRIAPVWVAIFFALAIALLVYGPHLFNLTVPGEGDVRSHIFKIEFIHSYLSHGSWPDWNRYWYDGSPFDPFYPPGFYFVGVVLTFILQNAVIAYKVLLLAVLASNGLVACYFARKFLKMDWLPAILCLIAYEASTPLLVNYLYGEGPDLLGWSVAMLFLTVYLCRITDGRAGRLSASILPGLLLGIAILIHPFPVIFVSLAVVLFHIIWRAYNRQAPLRPHLYYFLEVFILGGLIGMFYWLPALLTFKYASPIYTFTNDAWTGGVPYLLALIALALGVAFIIRRRVRNRFRLDFIIACLLVASILGFGATHYLPFGLSSLLHEFRFATIMAPFFGILIIGFLLEIGPVRVSRNRLALALIITICLVSLIYIIVRFLFSIEISSTESLVFVTTSVIPIFLILSLALGSGGEPSERQDDASYTIAIAGVCLILLTCVIPLDATWKQAGLVRLVTYVDNLQQPQYAEILQAVENGRLIVPMRRGYLTEGDSPVTFGWQWGVDTTNGPYNQGDPKFFKYTVHLEWEERWLDHQQTRENLMQEGDAAYVFIRGQDATLADPEDLTTAVSNSYGNLLRLNEAVARADQVTPILLDVKSPQDVTEFFNILMPQGYKMVFVDAAGLNQSAKDSFSYVFTDDASKIPQYAGKTVFLLNDTAKATGASEDAGVININAPVKAVTDGIFYHGDEGNVAAWGAFENSIPPALMSQGLAAATLVGNALMPYLEQLKYEPASYQDTENTINISSAPGFTLVKNSYFPYWRSGQGTVLATTQGFMLVYLNASDVSLVYKEPRAYTAAALVTIIGLVSATSALLGLKAKVRRKPNKAVAGDGSNPPES